MAGSVLIFCLLLAVFDMSGVTGVGKNLSQSSLSYDGLFLQLSVQYKSSTES